jgi:hypothetical protein
MSTENHTVKEINIAKEVSNSVVNYLVGLLFVLLLAEIGLTWRFTVLLYYYLSFGIIALLIPIIIAPIFLGMYLKKHSNPLYRRTGEVFDKLFGYTAIMQGIFYITLIFMIVGGLTIATPSFEDTRKFMFEWIMGSMYASFLIYGLAGFMLFWSKNNFISYILCICVLIYGWGGFILVMEFEKEFSTWYYAHTVLGNILYFCSQLLFSFLYMHLMIPKKNS